jgi:mono/diheme cytochrome c family protein
LSIIGLAAVLGTSALVGPSAAQDAAAPAAAPAAAGTPVAYPSAQARQGSLIARDHCATCHGDTLGGLQETPALVGASFHTDYWGQPLSNLYDFISTNMPLDAPGSLKPEEYAAVLAYILSKNDIAATDGAPNLPGDSAALGAMTLPPAQ